MGPLQGIRVIDIGLLVQGPQAAALLGDMGADVIKVELPGFGDQARGIIVSPTDFRSGYFIGCNRGKRSVTIDLRTAPGKEIFLRLCDTADVLIGNFKPGTLEGWGIGYDVLAARNPRLVVGLGSSFGSKGPWAEREGADLAGQASGGLLASIGVDGTDPSPVGVTIADHTASSHLAAGVLAALFARHSTGRGQLVEVSLLGSQVWAQASEFTQSFLSNGDLGRANYGHPILKMMYGVFPTSDGWFALVGVPIPRRAAFAEALGNPAFLSEPEWQAILFTKEQRAKLQQLLGDVFRTNTSAHWLKTLHEAGIRVAPVRSYGEIAEDPQVWENGYLTKVQHPEWGEINSVGTPIAMSETPLSPGELAPELGQHTEEVLLELGYSWDDIARFQAENAV